MRGDRVEVAWRKDEQGQIEIVAARLHSNKHGRTFTAYQWQAPGDTFASWWAEDGTEVPFRLQNGPIKDYQQITSLLKDRPTHEGMDFKAPTGSPIVAPRAGVVTRTNWNWSANGNCVEVQFDDGAVAKFLHLDENSVKAGDRVQAGQMVGRTGNTGHSFGPHLHYQVEKSGRVVDPIDYHGTVRRKLDPAANPAFVAEMARLDGLLGQKFVER
jgi:murein DD-endopeptidase MepM/ murein hydrolase activator NlpD